MAGREARSVDLVPLDPPLVTVHFRNGSRPSWGSGATAEVAADRDAHWAELATIFPGVELVPLFIGVQAGVINDLVARGQRLTPSYVPPDFLAMFRVQLPPRARWGQGAPRDGNLAEGLRRVMLQHLPIESASVETVLAPPPLMDSGVGAYDLKFLDPAPVGLDVAAVWDKPDGTVKGKGAGETLADVERGWFETHPEFSHFTPLLLPGGELVPADVPHGTMSLSVAVAREDGTDVVGVAPLVTDVVLSSEKRPGVTAPVTEAAIMDAIVELVSPARKPGSVLLLEVEKLLRDFDTSVSDDRWGPSEMKLEVFQVIQLAVANHIVVVEAAGNGASGKASIKKWLKLDNYSTPKAPKPGKPQLLHGDSGAILVGQSWWSDATGAAGNHHEAVPLGCTGERIDCFGWGYGVAAASADVTVDPITVFIDGGFAGTSSASAMIAGAALVVQGLVRAGVAGPLGYLTPPMMRALLRERTINTPLKSGATDVIGVMPDLAKIVERLEELPDLYIRDNLLDTGAPSEGRLWRSPDIIVQRSALPAGTTPDAAFGEGSLTEDNDDLSEDLAAGQPALVYVRVRNRGEKDVNDAKVTVWYADSGTLLRPIDWTLVGDARVNVPSGDTLAVAGPIAWPAVPGAGHYCFIALVEHPEDPGFLSSTFSLTSTTTLTIPAEFNDLEYFKTYIRNENNAAWRNFHVFEVSSGLAFSRTVSAKVAGAAKGGREPMELRVEGRLPRGSKLELELPEEVVAAMKLPATFKLNKATKARRGEVKALGVTHVGLAHLPGGKPHSVMLHVSLPKDFHKAGEVALIQLHRGQVIGRMTWHFKPEVTA